MTFRGVSAAEADTLAPQLRLKPGDRVRRRGRPEARPGPGGDAPRPGTLRSPGGHRGVGVGSTHEPRQPDARRGARPHVCGGVFRRRGARRIGPPVSTHLPGRGRGGRGRGRRQRARDRGRLSGGRLPLRTRRRVAGPGERSPGDSLRGVGGTPGRRRGHHVLRKPVLLRGTAGGANGYATARLSASGRVPGSATRPGHPRPHRVLPWPGIPGCGRRPPGRPVFRRPESSADRHPRRRGRSPHGRRGVGGGCPPSSPPPRFWPLCLSSPGIPGQRSERPRRKRASGVCTPGVDIWVPGSWRRSPGGTSARTWSSGFTKAPPPASAVS